MEAESKARRNATGADLDDDLSGSERFALDATRAGVGYWLLWASLFSLFGIALSTGLLALSLLAAVFSRQRRMAWWPRSAAPLGASLVAFAVASGASALASLDPAVSLGHFGSELLTLSSLPLIVFWVRRRAHLSRLVNAVLALAALASLVGIAQSLGAGFAGAPQRPESLFSHYMTFSGLLVLAFALVLGRLATADLPQRRWHMALTVLYAVALMLTLTRGAWIAALIASFTVLLLRRRRWLPAFLLAFGLGAAVLAVTAPSYWERARSIVQLDDDSSYDRLCMLWSSAQMVRDRPVFGLGDGMVERYYPIYRHPSAPRTDVAHLHNTYAHLVAEKGIPALLTYLALFAASFWLALRLRRDPALQDPTSQALVFGTLLTLFTFSLAGLFEANWRDTEVQRMVLLVLALPAALAKISAGVAGGRDQ